MRWEDERYVRLYTRDTATWKLLPWQGRALLPLLLRKADRLGLVDVEGDRVEGVAALVDLPPEVVEPGLAGLLARGVVVEAPGGLAFPRYTEAQEARASDRLRAQDYRARKTVTHRDEASRTVTDRHDSSHGVTRRHPASHGVTPSLASPSLAKQNPDPSRDPASAHEDPILGETAPQGSRVKGQDGSPRAEKGQAATGVASNPSNATEVASSFALEPPSEEAPKAPKPAKAPKAPKAPPPADAPPLVGTLAHRVYSVLVGDRVLCPITVNPGDFAARIADPETYPGVDVLAEVRKAAEYASGSGKTYTDGRAYLRNWLNRRAQEVARQPRPATPAIAASPAPPPPVVPRSPPPTQEDLNRSAAAAREIGPKAQALFAKIAAEKGVRFGAR